jgi:glucose/arabinose dehydrogenase
MSDADRAATSLGHPKGSRMIVVRRTVRITSALLLLLLVSCSGGHRSTAGSPGPAPPSNLALQEVQTGLDFPVYLASPPADTARLFVVEKGGVIRILKSGVLLGTPFLDVSSLVSGAEEQGLLSMAFAPDYATSGRFYISYTDVAGNSQIARYHASPPGADVAVASADEIVLSVGQPADNHNGGLMAFGPDGMLWIGFGDGGGGDDTYHTGQTTTDLLGSMLRIDVSGGSGYAIPAGNPFTGAGEKRELWNIGLRNPWRWSFDRQTGDLYIGDVGQSTKEEIDVALAAAGRSPGANYGWPITEGADCHQPLSGCDRTGLTGPVLDYPHDDGACTVVGGYVYRGAAMPGLRGTYFYADYCAHTVHSFRLVAGVPTLLADWPSLDPGGLITSFGQDARGELYLLTADGGVYRIVAA